MRSETQLDATTRARCGKLISLTLERHGMTQDEAAARLRIQPNEFEEIVSGRASLTAADFHRHADALGIPAVARNLALSGFPLLPDDVARELDGVVRGMTATHARFDRPS